MVSVTRCASSFAAKLRLRVSWSASAPVRGLGVGGAPGQRGDVGRLGQRGEPCLGVREQCRQRLRPHAVLARDVVEGGEPLLDPGELAGVEVELLAVGAQRPRGLVELDARRLEQRDDLGERRVVRGVLRRAGRRATTAAAPARRRARRARPRPRRPPRAATPRARAASALPTAPSTRRPSSASAASSRCRASRNSRSADDACAADRRGVEALDRGAPVAPCRGGLAGERR